MYNYKIAYSHTLWSSTFVMVLMLLSACSLNDLVDNGSPPANMIHPSAWENEAGALSLYNGVRHKLRETVAGSDVSLVLVGGIMGDELHSTFPIGSVPFPRSGRETVDSRSVPDYRGASTSLTDFSNNMFSSLQDLRMQSREAAKYIWQYFNGSERGDLLAYMLTIEAYATWNLAEMYCSGMPLPLYNKDGSFTLTKGFSREEVLNLTVVLVDSAIKIARDSIGTIHFANSIKSKAYLSLGQLEAANLAIDDIPLDYLHNVTFSANRLSAIRVNTVGGWSSSVSNEEGINGIDFITSGDPRTVSDNTAARVYFPRKYKRDGTSPVTIASGIDALLIKAEYELNNGKNVEWLSILNGLRNNGIQSVSSDQSDTVWNQGTGAVLFQALGQPLPGLRNLSDPGSDSARVSLHFRERAAWLFLTGNRQADLRRLVRFYKRSENNVYPTGYWSPARVSFYGTDVNLPVPQIEVDYNDLYGGCINRDA